MDESSRLEIRARLIFLFRLLRVDTVFSYDPWAHDEENPDHYVTAQAVEAACWMAGNHLDYIEHFAAGLEPKAVREKYYFSRRRHDVNRAVDISGTIDSEGGRDLRLPDPAGPHGRATCGPTSRRAASGPPASRATRTRRSGCTRRRSTASARPPSGPCTGWTYAEEFHWIGPDTPMPIEPDPLVAFIARHARAAHGLTRRWR